MSKDHELPEKLQKELENIVTSNEVANAINEAGKELKTEHILEAILNPELLDPEIHLSDEELDEFVSTFSYRKTEEMIQYGCGCESSTKLDDNGRKIRCTNTAIAAIEVSDGNRIEEVLVCRDDIRPVYKQIVESALNTGIELPVSINGKALPQFLDYINSKYGETN